MASDTVSANITIKAPAEAIFAVLVDPAKHAAIDGTGWVSDPLDRQPLAGSGATASLRSARSRLRSGSLTIGRRYPRSCAKQGQSSHLSPPITWTIC